MRSSESANVYMNSGGGASATAYGANSAAASAADTTAASNSATEQNTPFYAKKQGRLTTIGYLWITLGFLITIFGFHIAKNGVSSPMIPLGFVLMIFAYLRARKEDGEYYLEPSIPEKTGFIFLALLSSAGASQGDIALAISIMAAFFGAVILKRKLIIDYNKNPTIAIGSGIAFFVVVVVIAGYITK